MNMSKWREFAELHDMNPEQFFNEIIDCSQAILAMKLVEVDKGKIELINSQCDGTYKLTFERIAE